MSDVGTGILGFVGMSALAGVLVTAAVTPALAVTGMAANNGISMFENLPGYLDIGELSEKTDIYATQPDGSQAHLASFFDENREEVPWEAISQYVKDAAVAGEDPRFYEHGGVDIQGTIRGAVSTYILNRDVQGGSSITQQYVKNVLINNGVREAKTEEEKEAAYDAATETSPERKLKEMRYAIALEKKFSKDEILRGYLNIAAFGGRVYGIESASQYYFGGKHAADLTLAEAASLIAIVNHPEKFRLDYPESETNGVNTVVDGQPVPYADNKERRDYILGEMLKLKKITQEEYDAAIATPVAPVITEPSTGCQTAAGSAYFCDYVTWIIKNQFDDPATPDVNEGAQLLQQGGLQIHTTLDLELQNRAETAIAENVPYSDPRFDVGSVAVTVQPGTGRILAMAQNKRYSNDPDVVATSPEYTSVNYSTDFEYGGSSGLQPGSTYKVFTLAEWLNEGHSLTETFNGSRRAFTSFTDSCTGNWTGSYNPRNDDGRIANNAVDATAWSVNTSFMAMASQMDLCKIKQTAQAFGVHRADGGDLQMNPSDVLGTQEIAPVTMAAAFAGIANNGLTCTPVAIDKIVKADGTELTPARDDLHPVGDPRGRAQHGLRDAEDVRGRRHGHRVRPRHRHRAHRQDRYHRRREGHLDDRREHQGRDRGLGGQRRRRGEPSKPQLRQRRRGDGASPHLARDHGARRHQVRRRRLPRARPERLQAGAGRRAPGGRAVARRRQAGDRGGRLRLRGRRPAGLEPARRHRLRHRPLGPGRSWHHDPRVHEQRPGHDGPRPHRHERCSRRRPRSTRPGLRMKGGGGNPTGTVESQNPAPNSPAKRGDEVTVTFDDGGGGGNAPGDD